ncbi:hypothetical protein CPB84DRAFT_1961150 [Gymnopilus junonius]|uniref:Uncharacterized protein n=1 Tax=Gymnopilus junonius TaxID=109634 RepID=A0A9P5TQF7_GYMJU|nr:hypothetical protein CPB84DRAFT_1961150 [Gymnopilus junonius]
MSEPSSKLLKLNSQIYVSEPQSAPPNHNGGNTSSSDPAVVIIFSWIDARLSHVQKYADSLRSTFPTSTIVVVMVTAAFYVSMEKSREKILSPVVDILRREQDNVNISRGVLLFVMSNGGGFQLMTLRKLLLRGSTHVPASQSPIALVYDSTPGDNGLESAILSNAPSNPLIRLLVVPLIVLAYGVLYAADFLAGNRPLFEELRSTYLEADILPSISSPTNAKAPPRLYVYSKKDKMTLSKHVESHIKEAKLLGLDVTVEVFENTPHVAHARQDPDRYWGAVKKVWSRALQQVQSQL